MHVIKVGPPGRRIETILGRDLETRLFVAAKMMVELRQAFSRQLYIRHLISGANMP